MDFTTDLFKLSSRLFLFLVSFRRKVRKGFRVEEPETRKQLEEIFDEQERAARLDPRLDSLYEKARYPLVILADEVLLHSDWDQAPQWEQNLLEEKYFGTNIGGDKIFALASELRPDEVELASILYTAISLGVAGRYREKPEKLAEVKTRLYRQMSEYLAETGGRVTPDAYQVVAREARRLSPAVTLGRILIVAVGVLFFYVVISRVTWSAVVGKVDEVVMKIK
jgi:type IV/VI secretion system ImpK/VasF family protein